MLTEKFFHYLWKVKLLDNSGLITTSGEKIEILSAGEYNTHAGPDFSNAKIRIGETVWAGNVELHIKSSDWKRHNHSLDRSYNNVILHCVYEADEPVMDATGKEIPCLEMKGKFDENVFSRYDLLMQSGDWIPCEKQLNQIDEFSVSSWLQRLMVERLEAKTEAIRRSLLQNQNNWEETFYQFLSGSFGAKINAEPFEWLAKSLSIKILKKYKSNLFQLEALLFGTAGFLEREFKEEYPAQLQKEFLFLKKKHSILPMDRSVWKFLRLRPVNFPTVRIAQLASLVHRSTHLFSRILDAASVKELENLFSVSTSPFWESHFTLDKRSVSRKKVLGKDFIHLLIINTIVPFIFIYGKQRDEEKFITRSLQFLEEIPSEKNSIIEHWALAGIKSKNAATSQSLLQLKNTYCSSKRCLDCAIGNKLLSRAEKTI